VGGPFPESTDPHPVPLMLMSWQARLINTGICIPGGIHCSWQTALVIKAAGVQSIAASWQKIEIKIGICIPAGTHS